MSRIARTARKTSTLIALAALLLVNAIGCSKGERMSASTDMRSESGERAPDAIVDPEGDPQTLQSDATIHQEPSSEIVDAPPAPETTAAESTDTEPVDEMVISPSSSGFVFPPSAERAERASNPTTSPAFETRRGASALSTSSPMTMKAAQREKPATKSRSSVSLPKRAQRSPRRQASSIARPPSVATEASESHLTVRPSMSNTSNIGVETAKPSMRLSIESDTFASAPDVIVEKDARAFPSILAAPVNSAATEVAVEAMAIEDLPPDVTVATNPPLQEPGGHLSHLPAGSTHDADAGYTKVQVFYATDRERGHLPLSAYQLSGHRKVFLGLGGAAVLFISLAGQCTLRGRTRFGGLAAIAGGVSACLAGGLVFLGQAHVEKHGVTYTGDRGQLTRGVAEVTIPDSHTTGMVERPSLLKFEVREDQRKHVVLTSAVELLEDDFDRRLSTAVSSSADGDMLVFIHGYNVSFESALLRTAQISVDLPFEGVPVCYSWPSQGTLIGYPIDANNAEWTVHHLQQFLIDLAEKSGANSINVVAHSMGNRAMTAAMQQISWDLDSDSPPPFDRIVLAAPDVDADRFRRDFAPALVNVANQVTLYASSDDQALVASKQVNGYPRAGDSGENIVVVPGVETIDVSGIDLSLLGHSYYGDNESMLRDLYDVVRARLPATQRPSLIQRQSGPLTYWQLAHRADSQNR